MSARLIYVMGPSGAGKDSLLAWLRVRLEPWSALHWARRSITRPAQAGGEDHEALSATDFDAVLRSGGFALHWQANGLNYGVRRAELAPLSHGSWVMLNGSRAHLETCAGAYPGLTVLHISASPEVLRQRLRLRARESDAAIEARLQRTPQPHTPDGSRLIEVRNDGSLGQAGQQLLRGLRGLPGWPDGQSAQEAG